MIEVWMAILLLLAGLFWFLSQGDGEANSGGKPGSAAYKLRNVDFSGRTAVHKALGGKGSKIKKKRNK